MLKNEVEREVLALVLISIILVSLLGTWSIVKLIDNKQQAKIVDNYSAGSRVSLVILPLEQQPTPAQGSEHT